MNSTAIDVFEDEVIDLDGGSPDAGESETPAARKGGVLTTIKLGVLVILLGIAATYLIQTNKVVPSSLVGIWKTTTQGYSDRYIEIEPTTVSFGTGGGTETSGTIRKVQSSMEDNTRVYTITYESDGQPLQISFSYTPGSTPILRVKNQEQIAWTRE